MKNHPIATAIGISLVIVVTFTVLSVMVYHAMAANPTPQQQAAEELPVVLRALENDRPVYDRYMRNAQRKDQLLACLDVASQCPLAKGATPAL